MNYWILTTEYPPFYGGGISTYCYHTACMMTGKGHAVTVFTQDDSIPDFEVVQDGTVRLVRFNSNRSGLQESLGYTAKLSFAFAGIVRDFIRREGKPDCIESQEYLAIPYFILQYKLLGSEEFDQVPVLLTLHSPAFLYLAYNREGVYEFPNYWTGEMEKSCIRCADWIIAPSQYIVDEIRKHISIDETRLSVIVNPYLPGPFIPAILQPNRIVYYGKLSPQKGIFELFSYLRDLWDNGFPHPLTVIGGTDKLYYPEMKTMKQVITSAYSDYCKKGLIQFAGKVNPAERDEHLSSAHVILVPSRNDNLPYSVIEAMSLGKLVLASAQGGQRELISDGMNGFIFDHDHPHSFEEKLQYILSLDNNSMNQIGVRARLTVKERLNYDRVYEQKSAVIEYLKKNKEKPELFPFTREMPKVVQAVNCGKPGLLSVVIPYFNMGDYIDDCIFSVLQSVYTALEIWIVDDGSQLPSSIRALEKWEGHKGITVLHTKNGGVASARNYGAAHANGEFLAFLDADDRVHPDYYHKAITVLTQYENIYFAGCWLQFFGSKAGIWPTWNPEPPYILLHNSVNSSSLVYKTAAYLSGGTHDKKVDYGLEDYGSVINMLAHGFRGVVLPEILFFYRVRSGSMYKALTRYKLLHSHQYIAAEHADLYRAYAADLFSLLNANGPSFAYDNPTFGVRVKSKTLVPNRMMTRIKALAARNPALKIILLQIKHLMRI